MILTIPYQSPSELPALVEDEHMARLLEYCEGVMEGDKREDGDEQ